MRCQSKPILSLAEQGIVTLEIENAIYSSALEIKSETLTLGKARELANALLSVVDAIEFVSKPTCPSENCARSWKRRPERASRRPRSSGGTEATGHQDDDETGRRRPT